MSGPSDSLVSEALADTDNRQLHLGLVHCPPVHRWHQSPPRRHAEPVRRPDDNRQDILHLLNRTLPDRTGLDRRTIHHVPEIPALLLDASPRVAVLPDRTPHLLVPITLIPGLLLRDPTKTSTDASILACAQIYGSPYCGPWFPTAMRVTLWLYIALAFISAVLQYLHLFSAPVKRLTIQSMTPAWILPIFPIILGGLLASIIAPGQPLGDCWTMVVGGITLLGMGWLIAFLMYAIYLYRLTSFGLPAPDLRPGMFIAVGPPAFTGLAMINFGASLPRLVKHGYFAEEEEGAIVALRVFAEFAAVFLWAFAFWFFCVSLVAVVLGIRGMSFHLVWWASVFPNIALALVTGRVGERLESEGIMGVASAMAVLLVVAWLFVAVLNVRAVLVRQIMMPGKDEDRGTCGSGAY